MNTKEIADSILEKHFKAIKAECPSFGYDVKALAKIAALLEAEAVRDAIKTFFCEIVEAEWWPNSTENEHFTAIINELKNR